ncbi:MAG: hypothetical protein L0G87_05490 [Renibacterium salmoninarum]|nr:hypothetical protein [Renibacterium salmoninarum]
MSDEDFEITIEQVVLKATTAERFIDVEFQPPGNASVVYSFELPEEADKNLQVTTSVEITLTGQSGEAAALLKAEFLIFLHLNYAALPEPRDLSKIAFDSSNPYHRQLILDLSGRFDIPAYRLAFSLDTSEIS